MTANSFPLRLALGMAWTSVLAVRRGPLVGRSRGRHERVLVTYTNCAMSRGVNSRRVSLVFSALPNGIIRISATIGISGTSGPGNVGRICNPPRGGDGLKIRPTSGDGLSSPVGPALPAEGRTKRGRTEREAAGRRKNQARQNRTRSGRQSRPYQWLRHATLGRRSCLSSGPEADRPRPRCPGWP
jgi:hypothetical protein